MKTILAWIGAFFALLCIAGALGIGEFRLCYGPKGACYPTHDQAAPKPAKGMTT